MPTLSLEQESLVRIQRIADEKKEAEERAKELAKEEGREIEEEDDDNKPRANPALEQGAKLPTRIGEDFPPELYGKPIEDIDEFFDGKYVSANSVILIW